MNIKHELKGIKNLKTIALKVFLASIILTLTIQLIKISIISAQTWTITTVDRSGNVGAYNSIAVDSNNNPHISYYDWSNLQLKYAKWTGINWHIQTVDTSTYVGEGSSIAIDSNNNPHISYFDGARTSIKYARWTGTNWDIQIVDRYAGKDTSIAIDNNNNPHISYYDWSNHYLKYARWTGTNWDIQIVDSNFHDVHIIGTSIAIDQFNNPHISYFDGVNGHLKYTKWTGTRWDIQTVDYEPGGIFSSIEIDSNNSPHIAYGSQSKSDVVWKYAKLEGTNWNVQVVDYAPSISNKSVSIALDNHNNPHISYSDNLWNLKYAKWTGTEWDIKTVDVNTIWGGSLGIWNSIKIDKNNNPHISYSYYDGYGNWDLKYAKGTITIDTIPPSAITDLKAINPTNNSITLTWTAVGDDGNVETASQYDIRYAIFPIDETNWDLATQVIGEPSPKPAGSSEIFIVTGLSPDTTYYFAIKVADEVNWSLLSNIASATTLESIPPSPITDLQAISPTLNSITLIWTASGDDGNVGIATIYDIRYSTSSIDDMNWDSATQCTGEPAPQPGGSSESFTVTGLNPDTTYYFAIKVADEVPNWSGLSNVASGTTMLILIPPSPPTGLTAIPGDRQVSISWNASIPGTYSISYYKIYRSETAGGPYTEITTSNITSYIDTLLINGQTYYYVVKAVDTKGNESANSNEVFATPYDMTPPSRITDLSAEDSFMPDSVTLTWTAVGDDGNVGTASQYDIRYAIFPIDETNWDLATQVVGEPAPKSAGNRESFKVTGLSSDTTYYFAIKVADEMLNWAELSNVVSAKTPYKDPYLGVEIIGPDEIMRGRTRVYTIRCSNWGNFDIEDVIVNFKMPLEIKLLQVKTIDGYIIWDRGSILRDIEEGKTTFPEDWTQAPTGFVEDFLKNTNMFWIPRIKAGETIEFQIIVYAPVSVPDAPAVLVYVGYAALMVLKDFAQHFITQITDISMDEYDDTIWTAIGRSFKKAAGMTVEDWDPRNWIAWWGRISEEWISMLVGRPPYTPYAFAGLLQQVGIDPSQAIHIQDNFTSSLQNKFKIN